MVVWTSVFLYVGVIVDLSPKARFELPGVDLSRLRVDLRTQV